jgi:hypothetical protein
MPRIALDLNTEAGRRPIKGTWRYAEGFIPGQPNQGLVAEVAESPARLPDYDDSGWEVCDNLRKGISSGFSFGWWRITIEVPESVGGTPVAGMQVIFETNIDDYGEVWVDGEIDYTTGVVAGYNKHQRVVLSQSAEPGRRYVIACLGANGPFGKPRGGVWLRYATLAFENVG